MPRSSLVRVFIALIAALALLALPHPAHAGGWSWKTPNLVTLDSRRLRVSLAIES